MSFSKVREEGSGVASNSLPVNHRASDGEPGLSEAGLDDRPERLAGHVGGTLVDGPSAEAVEAARAVLKADAQARRRRLPKPVSISLGAGLCGLDVLLEVRGLMRRN